MSESDSNSVEALVTATNKRYVRVVGPRLRRLLYSVFALVALLGANAAYLSSITAAEWFTGKTYQNYFYQYMFLGHLILGLILILPFLGFGLIHMWIARNRRNRWAVRVGYALFGAGVLVLLTGVLLMRVGGFDLKQPSMRSLVYWLHVLCPLVVAWLYWLHRLAGPKIKWRLGAAYLAAVSAVVLVMIWFHAEDPRAWYAKGPDSGSQYFEPSLARTSTGNFIPASSLMNDEYCKKCHADVHAGWSDSVHRFSSFNNLPYLASVSQTRHVALQRDGNVQAARWCAGCHDPVPFFSGAFDDPDFDMLGHPTAHAGITCTVCHAITNVNSVRGNADYTIDEPLHYPFAYSENGFLQWVNGQLVKAKPSFHKKTFLKPFHKSAEFCATCHKVHLPLALNHYKEFLRGQNHYDSYLFSGVSGHGARSFYYPETAQTDCNGCHMPLQASDDFGAAQNAGLDSLSVHDHLFPSANTAIAWLRDRPDLVDKHAAYLQGTMRVDLFGLRAGGQIDGRLTAPLRPEVPSLEPGQSYLLETVIRTLKLGHHFTQGTADSNEIWLEVTVTSNGEEIGRSGKIDPRNGNRVDPWSHFVNAFVLDKNGDRIARRNAEDIFTTLYNHQIPPGAGQTVHYRLDLPESVDQPVTVEVKLNYRKFDEGFMKFVAEVAADLGIPIRGYESGKAYVNQLPIVTLATDQITFPVRMQAGGDASLGTVAAGPVANEAVEHPEWQRWNDYGIGLLLKGKAELRQATEAFQQVEALSRWDGPINLARAYNAEGRLDEAVQALQRAERDYAGTPGYPWWTWAWLSGVINRQQGRFEDAAQNLRSVLEDRTPELDRRQFDFSLDIEVINLLGQTLFDQGRVSQRQGKSGQANEYWQSAVKRFRKTLEIDPENVTAHYNLQLLYAELGDDQQAAFHGTQHRKYKPDDNAQGQAVRAARKKYPAANHAAEAVVIYDLHRNPDQGEETDNEMTSSAEEPKEQN